MMNKWDQRVVLLVIIKQYDLLSKEENEKKNIKSMVFP